MALYPSNCDVWIIYFGAWKIVLIPFINLQKKV